MNIIVNPHGCSACYCRPDTTWERENKDIYISEGIDSIYWTPVMFARISKAGKCIQKKFASRYYDSFNFGILIYTGKGDIAFTSCADHTSLLPSPLYNPVVMENEENEFIFFKNGKAIFSSGCSKDALEESLCRASCTTSLRIGDYIAVELAESGLLADRNEGTSDIRSEFCGNCLFDLKIIF